MKLGEYIRQLREARDLSLRDFAGQLGLSPAFISDIELGRRNPGKEVLENIAKYFDIAIEEIEKYDERMPVDEVRKLMQSNPEAGTAIGVLLRKKKPTQSDLKQLWNKLHGKDKQL